MTIEFKDCNFVIIQSKHHPLAYLVVLEDGQLDLPVFVLDLLGGGVVLLLLLGTSPEPKHQVKSRLLDVVVRQGMTHPPADCLQHMRIRRMKRIKRMKRVKMSLPLPS